MKNNTKSKLIITLNDLDNATKLLKFLKKVRKTSQKGGDLYLICEGAELDRIYIGHDVCIKSIKHVIYD